MTTKILHTFRTVEDLERAGLCDPAARDRLSTVASRYAVAVTPEMALLIDPSDPSDPIARQFVPDVRELEAHPGDSADPIGDSVHEKVPGLIHRYPDRVLLKLTLVCPVYCRFCFRREMVGPGGPPPMSAERLEAAVAYIRSDPRITEAILTGGDPLMLSARRIADVTQRLGAVPHLSVLRWHTRVPVVDPGRVTDDLVRALAGAGGKAVYVAIHANHPRELTGDARAAIGRLRRAGIVLASQTVLLKGVNDDAETLSELFRTFVALGVRPLYLHQMDRAPGTAHLRTTIAEGQALMRALRGRISGLAMPTYVLDIPGGYGKVPIGPGYLEEDGGGVTDNAGRRHAIEP
jgi:lysine 2,3-aminomutase